MKAGRFMAIICFYPVKEKGIEMFGIDKSAFLKQSDERDHR